MYLKGVYFSLTYPNGNGRADDQHRALLSAASGLPAMMNMRALPLHYYAEVRGTGPGKFRYVLLEVRGTSVPGSGH